MMISLFFILAFGMIQAGNINMVVEKNELECVYISKKNLEFLEATIFSGSIPIDLYIYHGDKKVKQLSRITNYQLERVLVNETMEIKFCFGNFYSRDKVIVSLEYDQQDEENAPTQLAIEKYEILTKGSKEISAKYGPIPATEMWTLEFLKTFFEHMRFVKIEKEKHYNITSNNATDVNMKVMHGDAIDFALFDPKKIIIYQQQDTDGYELEQKIHISGDYGFCFSSHRGPATGVHFEWDFHLGSPEEAAFKKKLEEEKRRFLMNKLKENQPKIIAGHGNEGVKPVEMHGANKYDNYDALEMDSVAHALLLISFNADRMEHYMNQHKSKQSLSHNLQIRNSKYINYYSIAVISMVILMSLVQVVVVKSFFSGKINLKIWEF